MALSAVEVNRLKLAPPAKGVIPTVLSRWSPRSFSEREVTPDFLAKIFEAARWAASSANEQPWRFLVGTRDTPTFEKIFSCLIGFNKAWAGKAAVLILGVAKSSFEHNGKPNEYALYDLGAAASYLSLQAASLGLFTHQMAGYDKDAARKVFGIPDDYLMGSVIALGYQGEPDTLANDVLIARETEPRTRKPQREFVFTEWGTPADLA
jgi:nitroreductase